MTAHEDQSRNQGDAPRVPPSLTSMDTGERIVPADLDDPDHARAVVELLDAYARDRMGGGAPLTAFTRAHLAGELRRRPQTLAILAFIDDEPAGLAICVEGFSTFACKPLLNVHDMVVVAKFRGRGLSRRILARAEEAARARGCCKLTLEVLEGNVVAQNAYRSFGFESYQLDPRMGKALFWQKTLE